MCHMASVYVRRECHTFICLTWLIRMCDRTHQNIQFSAIRRRAHSYVSRDSLIRVTFMCDMNATLSYVWHDSFIRVTWLIHAQLDTIPRSEHSYMWHGLFICVAWFIHVCDMTRSYVWHDSFICVTWLVHMCDMTHSYMWHGLFICVAWFIHVCCMTDSYARRDSSICVTWLIHMRDMPHSYACQMRMCNMTHSYVWHDSFIRATWLIHIQLSTIPQRATRRRRRRKNRKARGPTWWACWAGRRHHTYQKSPVFCQKSPVFCQKSPVFCHKSTIFCLWGSFNSKRALHSVWLFCGWRSPVLCQRSNGVKLNRAASVRGQHNETPSLSYVGWEHWLMLGFSNCETSTHVKRARYLIPPHTRSSRVILPTSNGLMFPTTPPTQIFSHLFSLFSFIFFGLDYLFIKLCCPVL